MNRAHGKFGDIIVNKQGGVLMTCVPNGICPKCGHIVSGVTIEHIMEVDTGDTRPKRKAISFCCRNCGCVLGVGFDPLEIVELVEMRLKGGK